LIFGDELRNPAGEGLDRAGDRAGELEERFLVEDDVVESAMSMPSWSRQKQGAWMGKLASCLRRVNRSSSAAAMMWPSW
jgi:hypothetical protein